jgi:hypothetical protein
MIALSACGGSARQAETPIPTGQAAAGATQPVEQATPDAVQPAEQPTAEATQPDDPENLPAALAAEVVDDRPEVLATLGRPDAFDISFVTVEGGQVRMESWRYYQFGTRVDFVDGEAIWTMEIEPVPDGTLFAAWYDPLDFEAGMSGVEVAQVIAAASPAGAAPERIDLAEGGEDLAGGSALVGDQIVVGLHEDRVVYVETMALVPGGGEQ